jgi:hypothetical protein
MFPRLLDEAYYLCTERALRTHYPFLFVDPDAAAERREWGAAEVGEPCRPSPREVAELFGWPPVPDAAADAASRHGRAAVAVPALPAGSARAATRHDAGHGSRRPLVLFAMAHAGFYRNFEDTIVALRADGVDVHVSLSKRHESIGMDDYAPINEALPGRFSFEVGDAAVGDPRAERLRLLRDVVYYSRPQFDAAPALRQRFAELQKPGLIAEPLQRRLATLLPHVPERLKDALEAMWRAMERRIPPSEVARELVATHNPAFVVVTPLVNFASREVDVVKAAQQRGVPTLLATASWDNLTNKGLVKVRPDRIAVWNAHMAREAVELHGMPPDHVWITGAPVFDRWFNRSPSRTRKALLAELGLDRALPLIVYLGSSRSIADGEIVVIKEWIAALRAAQFGPPADVNVIVRPHPMSPIGWSAGEGESARLRGAVVWPHEPKHPTSEATRAEFFDILYHADAVVGLNTSAMIEAAILEKPVLTFEGHAHTASQVGNLHFRHLVDGGGILRARDLPEHVEQLRAVLQNPASVAPACRRFVADFVRPNGLQTSASASLAAAILREMRRPAVAAEAPPLHERVTTLTRV